MAGYTSTERKYGEYIQPFNLDLLAKSLSYKEGKYEEQDAKIRKEINDIGSLDILKPQDKSYLLSRLTSMVGNVNNVGTLDLADSGVVKNLDNYISQSIDDKVMNAYHSTKQVRSFNESMRDIQKNQKEIYNVRNEDFAMNPVRAYMASDKVGDELSNYGSLVYTPYQDIEGETNKQMMDIVKNMKDGKIRVTSPDGKSVYERDVRGMTDPEIRELVGTIVSSKYSEQAAIDSWARYDRYSQQGVAKYQKDVEDFVNFKSAEIDERNVYLNQQMNSVRDEGKDTSAISNAILRNTLSKEELIKNKESYKNNPMGFGAQLEREIIVSNLTSRYQPMLKKLDDSFIGKNEVYYADMENQFKEFDRNLAIEKLELDRNKDARENQEFELKKAGLWKGGTGSGDGTGKTGALKEDVDGTGSKSGIGVGALPTDVPDKGTWEDETIKVITEKNQKVQDMTKDTYDYIVRLAKEGDKRAIALISEYDLKRKGKHNGSLFREIYSAKASSLGLQLVEDKDGNQIFTMGDLSSEVESFNTVSGNYKKRKDEFLTKNFNEKVNDPSFYKNLVSEDKIMVATPEGLVNLKELAIKRGLVDANGTKLKNVTDDAMIKNTIKANVILGSMKIYDAIGSPNKDKNINLKLSELEELGRIYGENLSSLTRKKGLYNSEGDISLSTLRQKAPRTYASIMNYGKGNGVSPFTKNTTHNVGSNQRVGQDAVFRGLSDKAILENKTVRKGYESALREELEGVGVNNGLVLTNPKNETFQKLAQQISGFGRPGDGTAQAALDNLVVDKIKEISFPVKQANGEMKVTFKVDYGQKLGVVKHEVFLSVNDLTRNAPGFMDSLDFNKEEFYYSKKGMGNKKVSTTTGGIAFVNPTSDFIQTAKMSTSLQREFGGLPFYNAIVAGLHKDDTRKFLYGQLSFDNNKILYKDIMTDPTIKTQEERKLAIKEKEMMYLDAVDNMINGSTNYVLDASFINDTNYAIQLKDKSGNAIAGIVQEGNNLKPLKKIFDNYESSAYTMFLSSMIEQEKSNLLQGAYEFSTPFKKLTGLK